MGPEQYDFLSPNPPGFDSPSKTANNFYNSVFIHAMTTLPLPGLGTELDR